MKNNNDAVIRRLTKRSLQVNKKRNFFITVAIVLTTLLIASVFSIGMSFLESMDLQQTRLMGTAAHESVTRSAAEQIKRLKQLPYVKTVGTGNHAAFIRNTPIHGRYELNDVSLRQNGVGRIAQSRLYGCYGLLSARRKENHDASLGAGEPSSTIHKFVPLWPPKICLAV
jgi:hypothetical protein